MDGKTAENGGIRIDTDLMFQKIGELFIRGEILAKTNAELAAQLKSNGKNDVRPSQNQPKK